MKIYQITKIWAWSLGIILFCTLPSHAQNISSPRSQQNYNLQEVLQKLYQTNVIYLGETHDNPEDHKAQLEIIQKLVAKNKKVAIAMEMFQRPYQDVLDRYIAGKITETQLIEQSEYEQRWVFPWENYAPILRFAALNKLPVLALNTPAEITRKVARRGLESLTPEEQRYIPPASEIRTDNAEYRQMVLGAFQQHRQAGHGSSASFERFFTAQVLWDETMAEAIAKFVKANPDYQVVVLAGQAHIIYGYGIPSRVERRLGKKAVQSSILLNPSEEDIASTDKAIADYFWITSPPK
ncbi:ChaN family lipoprotein [Microcoleus sp. FACHB-831]|uniref:ChaN family lipoprotein n=1 Tax=Microcoleus sp. FACHB-831 TaxID=2692827 RepID=UPI001688E1DF|nr:ChaN family lipoprotein [Microcoleus sp. FACHB-831]MBD1922306.1 ChaN family lipoprotein [Microcoleus sp. FACHB-831]